MRPKKARQTVLERQKAYLARIRQDPKKYEKYKKKDRKLKIEKYKNNEQLSVREQRQKRKQWRIDKQKSRSRRQTLSYDANSLMPPRTPISTKENVTSQSTVNSVRRTAERKKMR